MTRWVDRNIGTCVRSVMDALDLDKNGREKDAYEKYLQSIDFSAQTLLKDAACSDFHICAQTRKLVSMMKQCVDRVETLLGALPTSPSSSSSSSSSFDYEGLPSVPKTPPHHASSPPPPSPRVPISPLPHTRKRSSSRAQEKLSAPMSQAMRQNQQLMNAYRARMQQCHAQQGKGSAAHRATDLSLTLQRRMAENVALAKAREKAAVFLLDGTSDHPLCDYIRQCQFSAYSTINPLLHKCAQYYPNLPNLDLPESPLTSSPHQDYNVSDDFDDLFEKEADEMEEKVALMEKEALGRHFQNIASRIRSHLDKIQIMFTVAYAELDGATGRDLCYACVEEPFFRPLWPYLLALSRLANKEKEEVLGRMMQCKRTEAPADMGINPKFCLPTPAESTSPAALPYHAAIEELRSLFSLVAPLSKLECIVRISRQICHCVEAYYNERAEKAPSIGADDLLPILAYVVIQSRLPQLVSECHALEEFVHEGYLMGEEGYCLTSLQTAVNYVLSINNP
ncbi:hypothetical protein CAPTEDRAFT_225230 [Capitella teleta]|uniref:VPS9 domain-containing protein n=1 Tax=Capitella teleta TaxID=283909 RepID=R7TDH7_CAPTE|nr:hypothetical protein CAPTEDRAFT_225230 [Capitella teleta]|eukprot:ELT91783.1 hypothetical protein CAPTEDRAFT_225230 [Capitella teleta]